MFSWYLFFFFLRIAKMLQTVKILWKERENTNILKIILNWLLILKEQYWNAWFEQMSNWSELADDKIGAPLFEAGELIIHHACGHLHWLFTVNWTMNHKKLIKSTITLNLSSNDKLDKVS